MDGKFHPYWVVHFGSAQLLYLVEIAEAGAVAGFYDPPPQSVWRVEFVAGDSTVTIEHLDQLADALRIGEHDVAREVLGQEHIFAAILAELLHLGRALVGEVWLQGTGEAWGFDWQSQQPRVENGFLKFLSWSPGIFYGEGPTAHIYAIDIDISTFRATKTMFAENPDARMNEANI
jgi:hypothetical protein